MQINEGEWSYCMILGWVVQEALDWEGKVLGLVSIQSIVLWKLQNILFLHLFNAEVKSPSILKIVTCYDSTYVTT